MRPLLLVVMGVIGAGTMDELAMLHLLEVRDEESALYWGVGLLVATVVGLIGTGYMMGRADRWHAQRLAQQGRTRPHARVLRLVRK